MRKNAILIIIALLTIITSCESMTEKIIRNSGDANERIISLLKEHRIIFLSENHENVNPILFLSRNLENLYNNGLRYLIFEGITTPEDQKGRFFYFYPWYQAGWKIERQQLNAKINEINSNNPNDPITIIWGEDGFEYSRDVNNENLGDYFKKRDEHIFNKISDLADSSRSKKILVFYGGGHGSKNKIKDFSPNGGRSTFDWTPFSFYLNEKYGNDFISIDYRALYNYYDENMGLQIPPMILDNTQLKKTNRTSGWDFYDYYIFQKFPTYGINYQYDINKENLLKMIDTLENLYLNGNINGENIFYYRASDRGQFLCILYYLKLFFGQDFDFSLWNCNKDIIIELDKLKEILQRSAQIEKELNIPLYNQDTLHLYHALMYASYLPIISIEDKNYPQYLRNIMINAIKEFPEDLWPHYWLAFSYYLEKDYNNAKIKYDFILNQDLVYSMEILPKILEQQIAICLETNLMNEMNKYKNELENLTIQYKGLVGECDDLEIIY